jgi:hypothetical protein
LFQAAPGGGILIGGAITALTNPRAALAVAAGGALAVAAAAWLVLGPATIAVAAQPGEPPVADHPDGEAEDPRESAVATN